jgi:ABC-type sugar transport system substrate-binding protein/AraC-like DNA-binding protein
MEWAAEVTMPRWPRIGVQIGPSDPFWVQVREVTWQRAQALPAEVVEITIDRPELLAPDEQAWAAEELAARRLDALLCNAYPDDLLGRIVGRGLPVVYVSETDLRHPRFCSRRGLYSAASMLGGFLHARLDGRGTVLIAGGHMHDGDSGQSRLDGFRAGLPCTGSFELLHVPARWSYEDARQRVGAYLRQHPDLCVDAIFGLSDSLALGARDAYAASGREGRPLTLGINGDPLALAAVVEGRMAATVETDVVDIAAQAVQLVYRAACGEPLPPHFCHLQRLVTADNVAEAAARKLISLATLPTRLVGVYRPLEAQRAEPLAAMTVERPVTTPGARSSTLVKRAVAFIQQRYGAPLSRQEIADNLGVSKDYLGRVFQEELGFSLWEYLLRYRVLRAKELLRTTDYSVAEVAARVGFQDAAYFSRLFHQRTGCSPREYRSYERMTP